MTALVCRIGSALELRVNGSPTETSFDGLSRSWEPWTYIDAGRRVSGYPLAEVLPLMDDLWRLTVRGVDGEVHRWSEDRLDSYLRWRLIQDGTGWTLISADGRRISNVTEIAAEGRRSVPGTLEVWIGWEGTDRVERLIRRFADIHDQDITVLVVPSILSKVSSTARGRGRLPDLFMVQSDYLPSLVAAGLIQRLDGMDNGALLEKGRDAFTRDAGLWARPLYFDTQLVFYNPRLVAPPPEDWDLDDLERILTDLKRRGTAPITWNAYSAYWLISFQFGFGKDGLLESDGGLVIDDEPTREALGYLLDLQERGLLGVREREGMMGRFVTGDVGLILSGSYSIPAFDEADVSYAVSPYPRNPGTGAPLAPLLDFKGLAVSRRTYRPILARSLAAYLTETGVQAHLAAGLSKLPADTEALEMMRRGLSERPHAEALLASYDIGTVLPPNDVYPIFKNTMWKMLSFAFTGQLGVDELLEQGQRIIDEKLERRSP